jgi:ABC-type branched-subunit amino acid transport system substrate-binding protein
MRARTLVSGVAIAMLVAACSNAGSSKNTTSTIPKNGGATATTFGDLTKKNPVHAKGVTDSAIDTDAVVTITNNPTGSFAPFADGIRAYFAMVNDAGGIYGRQLKLTQMHDDQLGNNAQTVRTALSTDNAFATFGATNLFTGADLLARANQPTFIWNINPQMGGHNNIFGNVGAICFTCAAHTMPFLAKNLKATKVGIIAYGVAQESKDCATGIKNSFQKFPTAQVVFADDSLPFAAPLAADVTAMKNKGVTLIGTCIDFNESLTLGKEMLRQGLNATQVQPNGYDANFIAQNAQPLEGSIVLTQFVAFEEQPQIAQVQKLFEWTQKTHVPVKELTAYGWILADQFVTGLKVAGPDFTQQKVIDGLNSLTAYNASGFIPPIDWTKQHNDPEKDPTALSKLDCFDYVKVTAGKFVPLYSQPGKPWVCFDRNDPSVDNPQHLSFASG